MNKRYALVFALYSPNLEWVPLSLLIPNLPSQLSFLHLFRVSPDWTDFVTIGLRGVVRLLAALIKELHDAEYVFF